MSGMSNQQSYRTAQARFSTSALPNSGPKRLSSRPSASSARLQSTKNRPTDSLPAVVDIWMCIPHSARPAVAHQAPRRPPSRRDSDQSGSTEKHPEQQAHPAAGVLPVDAQRQRPGHEVEVQGPVLERAVVHVGDPVRVLEPALCQLGADDGVTVEILAPREDREPGQQDQRAGEEEAPDRARLFARHAERGAGQGVLDPGSDGRCGHRSATCA